MKKIAIISDSHGCFDQTLRDFLIDVDQVWHAGDFGSLQTADQIADFKPLRGVYGNIDGANVRVVYKEFLSFECEGVRVLMTHIGGYPGRYDRRAYEKIMLLRPSLFVCGHSHILKICYDKKHSMLCVNPGASGVSGFHRVRTAVRFVIDNGQIRDMEVGEWPRRRMDNKHSSASF